MNVMPATLTQAAIFVGGLVIGAGTSLLTTRKKDDPKDPVLSGPDSAMSSLEANQKVIESLPDRERHTSLNPIIAYTGNPGKLLLFQPRTC
jgi:hypothetical protein